MKYLLLFLFVLSCSSNKKNDFKTITVDMNEEFRNKITISPTNPVEIEDQVDEKELALFLVPSGYHSIKYLKFFEKLEGLKIKPKVITTNGFTAIVAAIYILEGNSKVAYWKVYKLLKKLNGETLYSNRWQKIVTNYIKENYPKKKMSSLKIKLDIPRAKQNLTTMSKSRSLYKTLRRSINIYDKNNWFTNPKDYSYFYINTEDKYQYFVVDAFPKKYSMRRADGILWGVLSKMALTSKNNEHSIKIILDEEVELDNFEPLLKSFLRVEIQESEQMDALISSFDKSSK